MQKLLTSFTPALLGVSPFPSVCLTGLRSERQPADVPYARRCRRSSTSNFAPSSRLTASVTDPIDSYYLYRHPIKLYALAVKKHVDLYASRLEVEHTITYWPWTPEARRFSKAVPDTMCKLLPA